MRRQAAALALLLLAGAPDALAQGPGPAGQGDARAGRRLAAGVCASCHGRDGIATLPEAPNLAGQNAAYVAQQLRLYRGGERQHEQMSIVAQGLSDQQIADLAAWYAAMEVTVTLPAR
jgi:cytochrome c553